MIKCGPDSLGYRDPSMNFKAEERCDLIYISQSSLKCREYIIAGQDGGQGQWVVVALIRAGNDCLGQKKKNTEKGKQQQKNKTHRKDISLTINILAPLSNLRGNLCNNVNQLSLVPGLSLNFLTLIYCLSIA